MCLSYNKRYTQILDLGVRHYRHRTLLWSPVRKCGTLMLTISAACRTLKGEQCWKEQKLYEHAVEIKPRRHLRACTIGE